MAVHVHETDDLFKVLEGRAYGIDYAAYKSHGTRVKNTYLLPVDTTERDRLDVLQTLLETVRGSSQKLTHVPDDVLQTKVFRPGAIDHWPRVLDLGCGTGLWMLQMSRTYGDANYFGLDINFMLPMYIPSSIIPSVPFDIESPWNQGENSYQLIHAQLLLGSIRNWSFLFQQARRHLAPGGWFESVEIDWKPRCDDNTMNPDPLGGGLMQWWSRVSGAYRLNERALEYNENMERALEAHGFKDVQRFRYPVPLCGWPAEDANQHRIGIWWNIAMSNEENQKDGCAGMEAMSLRPLLEVEGNWTPEMVGRLCNDAIREASNLNVRAYNYLNVVIARAPKEDGT